MFDGEHIPIATLPGMAERTLTISSIGKSFSVTGWKIGWCSRPAELVAATRTVKRFLTSQGHALQHASAAALRLPRSELETPCVMIFAPGATSCAQAWRPRRAARPGRHLLHQCRRGHRRRGVVPELPRRCGIVAIPSSVFYDDKDAARTLVRFAFCKRTEVIAEAARRLARLAG